MKFLRAVVLVGVAAASSSGFSAVSDVVGPTIAGVGWLRSRPVIGFEDLVPPAEPDPVVVDPGPRPDEDYLGLRFDLERQREALVAHRHDGLPVDQLARSVLTTTLPPMMEAWVGTRYSYSGTSQVPGEGRIACGYYVSTVLEHAGFSLDRVEVARQASEQIIRTIVPDPEIRRFRGRDRRKKVVAAVESEGPGLWVVGLDTHVGFLINDGERDVRFCHSTRRKRQGVVCEDAVSSPSLKSRYTVLGRLDNPTVIDHWLDGDRLVTARRGVRQGPSFGTLPEAGPQSGPSVGVAGVGLALLP